MARRARKAIHELWMRGEIGLNGNVPGAIMVRRRVDHSRVAADASRAWLPLAYEVTARFIPARRGRSNLYLVLLDYSDSGADPTASTSA
jgi:hypothetical protein